jgi:hypothetical protein
MMIERSLLGLPPAEHPSTTDGHEFQPVDSRAGTDDKVVLPADPPPTDLHAEPTRIKQASDLHSEPTRIKKPGEAGDLHALQTRILQRLPSDDNAGKSLHELETAEKVRPGAEGRAQPPERSAKPAPSDSLIETNPIGPKLLADLSAAALGANTPDLEPLTPSPPILEADTDSIPKAEAAAPGDDAPAPTAADEEEVEPVDESQPGDLHVPDTRIVYNPLAEVAPTTPFERESEAIETAPPPSKSPLVGRSTDGAAEEVVDPSAIESEEPVDNEEAIEDPSVSHEVGGTPLTLPTLPALRTEIAPPPAAPPPPQAAKPPADAAAPEPLAPPPEPPPRRKEAGEKAHGKKELGKNELGKEKPDESGEDESTSVPLGPEDVEPE